MPANFSLINDGTPAQADRDVLRGLAAGAYRFTAATPAGWRLSAIKCVGTRSDGDDARRRAGWT